MMSSPAQVVDALGSAVDTATDHPLPESLRAQIDNLQKLVNALMQKLQDQEDSFLLERLTWEAGDEHHDEEESKPQLRMDEAPSTPKRQAQPEHFDVSLVKAYL